MSSSSLVGLRSCTPSYSDNSYAQLQLLAPPESTAACLSPPPPSRRRCRSRISVLGAIAKPSLGNIIDMEELFCCGCKPQLQKFVRIPLSCSASPLLDRPEGSFVMQTLHCFQKRKNHTHISVVCSATKPMLDRCSNDADNTTSSMESFWTEEVISSLQRSLLESQWTLQSVQSRLFKDERITLDSSISSRTEERTNTHVCPQQLGSTVVRSGQASARCRRLSTRSRAMVHHSGDDSSKALDFTVSTKLPGKKKRGKVKPDPLQDFISSFLRPTNGCGIFTKEQEQGFTKQMRVCQNLEKARNELKKKLGYDPPYELWAQSVNMSTGELLTMVKEGEIARNKMVSSHLRLVVAVAKSYQNLGVDVADLVLEGSKGLLRGLEKFDHRKGYKMSTYVHWWIRQGVTRAIADHSRLVRVPVYLHEIMFAIRVARESLRNQGKPATVENLSSMLNVPEYRIRRALQAKSKVSSLDKSDGSYGLKMEFNGLHEFVADRKRENRPWSLINEEDLIGTVRDRLNLLTPREQDIIRCVYGIDTKGGARTSLTAIGLQLGISKERVRQIKARALLKMRPNESNVNAAFLVDAPDHF